MLIVYFSFSFPFLYTISVFNYYVTFKKLKKDKYNQIIKIVDLNLKTNKN